MPPSTPLQTDRAATQSGAIMQSLQEYGRGVAGGLLFSLPLLYTMEVWWFGFTLAPERLIIGVLATFVLLLGYNRYAGLRNDASFAEVAIDSIEELGLGLVLSAVILWILGQVTLDMQASEIIGKIVVEAMLVAIGVSVGTAQLGASQSDDQSGMQGDQASAEQSDQSSPADDEQNDPPFQQQLILSLCGAMLIAANVAPTEEIIMISTEIAPWRLPGLMLLSLALGALIVFFSDFKGTRKRPAEIGVLHIIKGVVLTYAVALVASAAVLWFFGRFQDISLITAVAETIVLGVASTLGASAGRMLLQQ